ncbi:MAG TPA: hypothetical protein PLC28_11680 [Spirochaetota bacterium]|nr:hypothetical protein [Spirochaetota bacterium]HPC39955.1 hypothetical protein [Spirochaetota bacterium]HPL16228.1 hypothetical protein [Spirochaetota bacterium]HQJ71573.1 hypothetical protein [Spirochaetota bacterium]HRT76379.1 hypothetical protein [Spirochaetota bacterium]
MRLINEITVIIRKKSFPSFIDELYKRECDLLDLQHIEESGDGYLYTLRIACDNLKRFEEFVTIISSAGDKYKFISVKNIVEDRIVGGLLSVSGKMPLENITDFNTSVLGAADLMLEKIKGEDGRRFTSIARNVGLVAGIRSMDEGARVHLLREFVCAERDAVVLNRFAGLNGSPLAVRFEHPEDVIQVLKKIEQNYAAVRVTRISESSIMLYDMLFSDLTVPTVSLEHDDIPLFLLILIIKVMMKYRIKAEETTVGLIGIDLSSVRLARVLDKIGFRRILGFDHGETSMLALENQGGLATTAENIFGNADITILLKNNFDVEEFRKIRPGQFVISFMESEEPGLEEISGKGVREFIRKGVADLAVLFPGVLRGMIDADIRYINDAKLVDFAKKLVVLLSDSFEFPHLFGDVHEKVYRIVSQDKSKS